MTKVRRDAGAVVVVKQRCCDKDVRCARCPVVWRKLERAGEAERLDRRTFRLRARIPKRRLRALRRR